MDMKRWYLLGYLTLGCVSTTFGLINPLIADILDPQDRKILQRNSPRTVDRIDRNEPLTINDIIKLSQNGIHDESMIEYMRNTNSFYHLSQTQIRRLQDAGVSQRVIDFMVRSGQ
ncbi:MAG: hypothetical protein Q8L98_02940 [Chlamydiales bacterium]|nr:hypothetical protein [Chlamydiales bacterium]